MARHVLADSRLAAAAAAAPASAAVVTSITVADGDGLYEIRARTREAGTVDANSANFQLKHGATVVGALLSMAEPDEALVTRELKTGDVISIVVGAAAGGAGSIYAASLVVQRVDR